MDGSPRTGVTNGGQSRQEALALVREFHRESDRCSFQGSLAEVSEEQNVRQIKTWSELCREDLCVVAPRYKCRTLPLILRLFNF